MLKILPLITAALLALSLLLIAQDGGPVLRVIEAEDQIAQIQVKTRHTTVIVLPATENVLDFVVGDSEYWHLTGAANLAFLKPIAEGVTTNVALVCESGRIYSFLVTEQSAGQPHLVVLTAWRTRQRNGRSWSRVCGTTGGLPTFARTPRSRPRSTNRKPRNRHWWPTTCRRTGCISPAMF